MDEHGRRRRGHNASGRGMETGSHRASLAIPPTQAGHHPLRYPDQRSVYARRPSPSRFRARHRLPSQYPYTRRRATMPAAVDDPAGGGFGSAEDTNQRWYLLAHSETGLSTDFDLPTLLGRGSDHPLASRSRQDRRGDRPPRRAHSVGRHPAQQVSTSMAIASAFVMTAMYEPTPRAGSPLTS